MLELHNVTFKPSFLLWKWNFYNKKRRQRLLHTQYREPQVTVSNNLLQTERTKQERNKLTKIVQKFHAFYETQLFITPFTTVRHRSLS